MVSDFDERVIIAKAISAARDAYENSLEEQDIDPSYFQMDIKIRFMDVNFEDVLHTIEDRAGK